MVLVADVTLAVLLCPAGIHIFLCPFMGPGLLGAGNLARLDRLVLIAALALHWGSHDLGIQELAAHGQEPLIPEHLIKALEQSLYHIRLCPVLPVEPERLRVRPPYPLGPNLETA